ncbi:aldehyde dehydrogenase family protein [Opitutus terrae]|uniref:Aldehyde dehydrogenase (NAD(+)) n=1 Tax=Opitutus terrae (strain DSM 11246 / JCM 15787 / PB90-1) TaxID=452637 RepID=B1ZUU7_OPITP|nr:aldehyde dehydrogenase family protein [Opitutus terrae]ACB74979.1 Aldehyde dehydrogenase (NAD(+)) [Opitutus terrae PB90-1]
MATLAQPSTEAPAHYADFEQQFIAGRWRTGTSQRVQRDLDPYTGETLVEIPQASKKDLDEAYRSAAAAQRDWAARLPGERAAVLQRVAAIMEARHEEIVSWIIRESGGTRIKGTLEWAAVHAVALEATTLPHLVEGRIVPSDLPGKESRVYRQPVGVVGVISPWNWPLQLTARSLFPALAVGNAVVVKPASDTPITGGLLFAKLLEEAGLPEGVLSVVVGAGSEIGDDFVTHPVPRVISFTGSTPVGRRIGRLAMEAAVIKRLELELGGNSPFVVLDDADIEHAIEAAVFGKFLHQGQICMIANRFIVDDAVYDEFVHGFVDRVRALRVGDPNKPDTLIGPIINQSQFDGLQKKIRQARADGLEELLGSDASGLVLPPHVFGDVPNEHPLAHEEIFGPIAPMVRAHGEEDALRLANDTSYGLSSAVFTRDVERGLRFARRVEAGMTHINDQSVNDLPFSPFGGEKNSGIGRFNGKWAVDAFTTDHWITIQHTPREYPQNAQAIAGPWGGG